jgi:predicted RNA-binding protein
VCESNVYILKDGREELVLESVDVLENQEGKVTLVSMFGEREELKARVKNLSLVDHKIVLEPV